MIIIITTIIFVLMILAIGFYLKAKMIKEFIIAILISTSWVLYYGYNYTGTQFWVLSGKLNVFAWVSWILGLLVFAQLYEFLRKILKSKFNWKAIAISGAVYLVLINALEWIGYNWMKIQLTTNYDGLFGMELMHGSTILKVYYLSTWLIFIALIELIELGVKSER